MPKLRKVFLFVPILCKSSVTNDLMMRTSLLLVVVTTEHKPLASWQISYNVQDYIYILLMYSCYPVSADTEALPVIVRLGKHLDNTIGIHSSLSKWQYLQLRVSRWGLKPAAPTLCSCKCSSHIIVGGECCIVTVCDGSIAQKGDPGILL